MGEHTIEIVVYTQSLFVGQRERERETERGREREKEGVRKRKRKRERITGEHLI